MSHSTRTGTCQLLYRDSSAPDGILSRGSGWHTRNAPRQSSELSEGDLLRRRLLPAGEVQGFHVKRGRLLVQLPRCREVAEAASLKGSISTARGLRTWVRDQDQDWSLAWRACPPWVRGFLAVEGGLEAGVVLGALWGVVEALLHRTSQGAGIPGRVLRLVRESLLGRDTKEALERTYLDVAGALARKVGDAEACTLKATRALVRLALLRNLPSEGPRATPVAFSSDVEDVERYVALTVIFLVPGDDTRMARSLDFLRLQKLPLSALCLALGQKRGSAST